MKKGLSFFLLIFFALFCHAINFEDVEAYELMPVEFNRQVKILSEKVTQVFTMNDGGFKNLFSSKTLCGPVKHWGVMNVNFGRLYLWTK